MRRLFFRAESGGSHCVIGARPIGGRFPTGLPPAVESYAAR